MNKIIALCGYGQVGKDTLAEQLGESWQWLAFADTLKREVDRMLARVYLKVDTLNNEEDKKEWRDMLVFWGKRRRQLDPDYWIKELMSNVEKANKNIIITDCRYLNEVKRVIAEGGHVIRLRRPGYHPLNDEEANTIGLIDREYPDLPMLVNDGTKEQLKNNFLAILELL